MNIVITHEFPFEKKYYGGGNQIVKGLSTILAQKNHNVTILTNGKDEFNLNNNNLGVKYLFLTNYSKFSFLIYYLKLFFYLYKQKPDFVLSFTSESFVISLYCKMLKLNSALYQAAPEFPNFTKFNFKFFLNIRFKFGIFLQFLGIKFSPHVYTISDYTSRMLIKEWGASVNKVSTLGLGLDNDILNMSNYKNEVNYKNGNFKLLSFGRITFDQKPFNLIVQPLYNLIQFWDNWVIIGDGPDLNILKNTIENYKITDKVKFTGTLETNEIINYLKNADIVILPSNYESFFITVYESLLFNKIVITDDVADIKINLDKFNNIKIVNSKDPILYQNAIEDIFLNYNKFIFKANEASTFIKNKYNWEEVYKKLFFK